MPLRLKIDAGGEYLLPFAKKKLRELKAEMRRLGQRFRNKYVYVTTSETVFIQTQHVFENVFLDLIRISSGSGCVILQTGANEYAVVRWDGSLVALANTTGHPHSGFAMHEAIGDLILFAPRSGPSAYIAYAVDAKNFSAVNGPEDFSAVGYASFTYWQPPIIGEVLPPKQWAASIDLNSIVSLSQTPVAIFDQDFLNFSSSTLTSGSTGVIGALGFQWNGNGRYLFAEIGRDSGAGQEYAMIRVDPQTAAHTVILFPGTNVGSDAASSTVPMCVNSTQAIRPVLIGGAAYLDVRSLEDGSQLASVFLPEATEYLALRADDSRAFVVATTGGERKGFVVNLASYAVTDISDALNAWLTGFQSGFLPASRAIILPGNITGAVAAPPEGGEGGGGPRGGGGR